MLQIIDSTGKARNVKKARIAIHTIPDEHGVDQSVKCVEFMICGKNSEWPSWMTLEEFNIRNANVDKGELGIEE